MKEFVKEFLMYVFPSLGAIAAILLAVGFDCVKGLGAYITERIKDADLTAATGPEKMDWVVQQVKAYLPTLCRAFFNDTRIRALAQTIFDNMKNFAMGRTGGVAQAGIAAGQSAADSANAPASDPGVFIEGA